MSNKMIIQNAKVVTEHKIIDNGTVVLSDGKIEWVGLSNEAAPVDLSSSESIDAKGSWVLPGFIDVHVHGGFGSDFMDGTKEALDTITRFHGAHGTTGMLATTVTASQESIDRLHQTVTEYVNHEMPGAQLLGIHLEGPFISPKWPGAQNPNYIVPPQIDWIEQWEKRSPGLIRMLTLAPETEGALRVIEWVTERGIIASAGHTDATYDQIQAAADKGLRHAVHTFNAMTGLHHRNPGTVGAVMTDERISAEIIADGHHVHPACIQILEKMKTGDKLIMITDAISAAGLGDGTYNLGGLEVVVQDGVARLKHGNSLAGSTLTMISAFRFCVKRAGIDILRASQIASANPAKLLGIYDITGSITTGKQADVLLVSPEFEIEKVWVKGKLLSAI